MLMKTETINRKIYVKPAIVVLMLEKQKPLLVDSDEYYYQGAPDDWHLKKQQLQAAVFCLHYLPVPHDFYLTTDWTDLTDNYQIRNPCDPWSVK